MENSVKEMFVKCGGETNICRNDPHACWTISAIIVSYVHLENCPIFQQVWESFLQFISQHTSQVVLSLIIPFTGTQAPNKLTCSHLSGFIAQLVRALHYYSRGHGFKSPERYLKIFRWTYETIAEIVQQGSFLPLKWTILSKAAPHSNTTKNGWLCLTENFFILCKPKSATLNKKNELLSACRYKDKFLTWNVK